MLARCGILVQAEQKGMERDLSPLFPLPLLPLNGEMGWLVAKSTDKGIFTMRDSKYKLGNNPSQLCTFV